MTTDPTALEAELLRLRELEAKAEPGLWTVYRCEFDLESEPDRACGFNGYTLDASYDECHHTLRAADAVLIVAMRNALPTLLTAFEQQQGEIERLNGVQETLYVERNYRFKDLQAAKAEISRLTQALQEARAQLEDPDADDD